MPPSKEVQAFDILLCDSKQKELKEKYDRQMHLTPDEARNILKDVGKQMQNILEPNIKSALEHGSNPLDSVQYLLMIESMHLKLDGLNSLLKFKEILSKLDTRFKDILRRLNDDSRHQNSAQATDSLRSAKKIVKKLESWTFWIREFCFLNSIFGSMSLRRAKKVLQKGHANLLKLKANSVPPNVLDVELDFSTAKYYLQNVEKKLAGEDTIIQNSQSEMKRVKDRFKEIKDRVKKEEQLEIEYIDFKGEYRARKDQLSSWRQWSLAIFSLIIITINAVFLGLLYARKVVETTDSVTVAPWSVRPNVTAHVALVNSQVYRLNDLVLHLNNEGGVSSSSVQHVEGVTLLNDSLKITHAGVYEVYYSIHIKPEHDESCPAFGNKPFQSYVLRRNPQDHSLESKLLWNSHSCCECVATEETKFSSGVFELNVGDLIQVIWQSKKRPVYFHELSSFIGLSMR